MNATTTPARRGTRVQVLRPATGEDCTLGGISSLHAELTVVGVIDDRQRARKVIELGGQLRDTVTEAAPAVWLHARTAGGIDLYSIVPAQPDGSAPGGIIGTYQFGSNWANGGGTFRALMGGAYAAVAIHDRAEGRA